jgi:hypothetical protein
MDGYWATEDGLVLEGRLTVVSDEHTVLIQVGEEFLDECLWRRFRTGLGGLRPMTPVLRLERVRITVERLRPEG